MKKPATYAGFFISDKNYFLPEAYHMKQLVIIFLIFFSVNTEAQLQNKIDYQKFLAKQDLIFDTLSSKWEEGAFLGNGLLGVMVYREDANAIRFDLGRTDVVDHRTGINPSIGRARLPIGKFVLHTSGNILKIKLRLDLWNAELNGTITTDKGTIELQALVPASKDVILINTTTSDKKNYSWEWKPESAVSPFLTLGRDTASKYPANPIATILKNGELTVNYQPLLAGGAFATAWKSINIQYKESLVITIANSFPEDNTRQKVNENLSTINQASVVNLIDAHRKHWHTFYQKSFLSIPDSRLQSFWWIQQYKMASATRVGAYPIDLMGPWYYKSPWPKYWWNLNIQLTYYPFFSSNHVDLTLPLLKMIDDNIDNLSKNTPEPYQHNAAALARSGPYDMTAGIKVLKGNDSTGSGASMELGNLTWLLHVYYQAYEYTKDKKYLKSICPVLTKAVNYYLNIMDKEADGKYHLPYTYSPEYPKGITRDANYDLSVLHWGLKTLLYINKELNISDALAPKWQDALTNLVPYPQDQYGFRIGKDASFTISHRHYSHLLMVYPIYDINWDQLQNRDLILRSLNQWKGHNEAWRGYSYTGSGSIYAMMGKGDSTVKLLNEMMKGRFAIKPNTMYLEAGPVIETPLSAVTTMNEMLLQSWGGIIRVFPAVPASWQEATFVDLRAKGSFTVTAVRKNGSTQFIKVKSEAGAPCLVKTGWLADVKAAGNRAFTITKKGDGVISIDLKKGEEVILYTGAKPASFIIKEALTDGKNNFWGLH